MNFTFFKETLGFFPPEIINFQVDAEFMLHHHIFYEVITGWFKNVLFQNQDLALKVNINIWKKPGN